MQFGLAGAYELGQWQATECGSPPERLLTRFVVAAAGSSELPFPSAVEVPPWSETVLAELGAIRAGIVVEWDLLPDPTIPSKYPPSPPTSSMSPGELRMRTLPERVLHDGAEARRTGLRWRVDGRILTDPSNESHEASVRLSLLLEKASHLDGGNGFRCRRATSLLSRFSSGVVLSEAELVGLFPPSASVAFSSRPGEPLEGPCLWLGKDLRGSLAGLPLDPVEGRHLLVLGETGMGKSSLVVRLAWQALHWGNVLFFDPVGDTAREFLAGLPAAARVSWVSPTVRGLTLSLLGEIESRGRGNHERRERLVDDVVSALRRVRVARYAESPFWGPRLEEMLSQALRAASQWPGTSLSIAERLLSPGWFASRPIPETAREAVADIRRRIERSPQDGDGARRLLSEITRSEVLRGMLDDDDPTWSVGASMV
ncbi:MAG: ATP-binding protein, partial [Thermoplasmata archaeon]|nr:ATP-binding protein [Thermoplasmata archaeon]